MARRRVGRALPAAAASRFRTLKATGPPPSWRAGSPRPRRLPTGLRGCGSKRPATPRPCAASRTSRKGPVESRYSPAARLPRSRRRLTRVRGLPVSQRRYHFRRSGPACGGNQMRGCGLTDESDVSALVDDGTLSEAYASDHRRHGVRASGRACDTGGLVSNTGALPRSQRSSCCAIATAACLRNAHSQTIATRQPAWSRSCRLRRSRSVFASNLARQNSWRVVGVVAYGQPECRCQKQPCTRHTAPNRRNTRSGVPGSLRSCRRNRSPRAWMACRRASSGRVFLLPIPAIMRERVARSTMSAIFVPARPTEERCGQQAIRQVPDVMQPDGILRRRAGPDWSARPRCGDVRAEDGAVGSPGGFGTASPCECDP